jgi:hypothetical protein
MAYTLQLINARNDIGIRNIAGVCNNGEQFADYVNRATRRLMKRGAWFGTECLMRLCTTGCDVVFPRHVGTVLGLRMCKAGQVEIRNNWWAILSPGCGGWVNSLYPGYGSGWGYGGIYGGGFYGGVPNSTDTNTVPIFNQVSGNTGKLIRYHVVKQQDYGKTITIYGKQYGGQPLQTEVDGAWVNGVTITAANPVAQTTILVTKIDSVVREATQGMAYLYEYDPATTKLRMLAVYEPSETNPSYRHMLIPAMKYGAGCFTDENDQTTYQFEALVKLQYIPVVSDNDFLLLDNLDALALAIQALKAEEANDDSLAEIKWTKAIEDLNFELRDKTPDNQFSVKVRVMGSDRIVSNIV